MVVRAAELPTIGALWPGANYRSRSDGHRIRSPIQAPRRPIRRPRDSSALGYLDGRRHEGDPAELATDGSIDEA
jgi:hypothetical protein